MEVGARESVWSREDEGIRVAEGVVHGRVQELSQRSLQNLPRINAARRGSIGPEQHFQQ